MTVPCISACSPWATLDDLPSDCDAYEASTDVLEDALAVATDVLFELSGERFPGSCEDTVRPCGEYQQGEVTITRHQRAGLTISGESWGGVCSCNRRTQCGCTRLSEIRLGGRPVSRIVSVSVDGVELDSSLYRVDDWRYLVRLPDADGDNPGWPCCQRLDLPTTEDETFEVTFIYGQPPPQAGVWAAAELACQIALARDDDKKCKLPKRVTSVVRQGISMTILDPMDFLQEGKTGIYMVDLFLRAYNPGGKARRASVVSPDTISRVRRTGT